MNKLGKMIVVLLFRTNWRKLVFVCGVITIGSVLIQISTLFYPLSEFILPLPTSVSYYKSLQLENVRDGAIVVRLNSSAKVNQSMASSKNEGKELEYRREMNNLKSISVGKHLPSHMERYLLSLKPDEALSFVKKDIENAPLVSGDDPELYAPLFRNISIFKRSYEWMERILKVYIYKEGKRPIFHQPQLTGIYASEGWFMKLMEENKQFLTKDPQKAHLFYLPYSARQLQTVLYVRNSHNMKPLSIFLRDYVNMLAAKYPFWNRTRGSDHFLVACHDWGPYTLTEHEELTKNTIKALCNADVSQWIFVAGKDVSLPQTFIRNPKKPLKNVGGRRVSRRPILAFFAGNIHGRVRPILLKHWANKDEDMRIYGPLPNRLSYPQQMKSSKYCICPMGFEVNSPRIVEAIYYECVPVIIADNFVPPLNEALNWNAFSVVVDEKDIPRLKEILLAIPLKRYIVMQNNVKRLQKHFLWNVRPTRHDLFHMILHSIWASRINQIDQIPRL
ncbi:Acetylglucosaminyltransferase EXT1/exostosin 1 [Handroanthus impetiginosus]|uniref:Acetylglucosaminyltransferase EXT1/exostosin 1 n=1 Tax=Handroanthus impetiginosus TaxID=429701 RepID=A0A2G9H756_9LAMI|nr:Acetylglucosaminyltransferase EXT1/exostosin 1 [Handroanthus impetiginosus]